MADEEIDVIPRETPAIEQAIAQILREIPEYFFVTGRRSRSTLAKDGTSSPEVQREHSSDVINLLQEGKCLRAKCEWLSSAARYQTNRDLIEQYIQKIDFILKELALAQEILAGKEEKVRSLNVSRIPL